MIYVVATMQLKPDSRDRMLHEIETVAALVRREDGCLEYSATVDIESGLGRQIATRPDAVTFIERWRDLSALQAHSTAPHMHAFRQRIADTVVSTALQVLSPV